jgi:hypothetical protein
MKKINVFFEEVVILSGLHNKQKQFGWLLIGIWGLFFYLKLNRNDFNVHSVEKWFYVVLVIVLVITILVPKLLRPFLFLWFLFGKIMGYFTSFIVLFISYYFILLPIVFISNIFTKKEKTNDGWIIKKSEIYYKKLY